MHRNAHMVDLLRPENGYEEQLKSFSNKRDLTEEDFNTIIDKAKQVKKAAEEIRKQRFGK